MYNQLTDEDLDMRWADQRQKLFQIIPLHDKIDTSLDNSLARAEHAMANGEEALETLNKQGNQLRNARSGIIEIDENMSRSRKIMNQIYVNIIGNKLVMISIIILELISICLIVYFKYIR